MAKQCKLVYLDKYGNESILYKEALKKHGPEEAERVYLREMQGLASIKYSINPDNVTDWDTFIEEGKHIQKATNDIPYYKRGANKYERTSTLLNTLHKPFEVRATAEKTVINREANKLLRRNPTLDKGTATEQVIKEFSIEQHVNKRSGDERFEEMVKSVEEEFEFKREAGTEIHNTLEDFVNLRNKHKDDPEWDTNRLAEEAVASIPNSNVQEQQIKLIKKVNKLLKNIGIPGDLSKFQFETEVPVWDDEMGIGGTVDLIIRDDKGTLHVFDYKTKEKGKEKFWDSNSFGTLNIPGMQINDNKESMAALQTSLYKEILMRKGFKVSQPKVIYVEAEVKKKNPNLASSQASNLMYSNFSNVKIKPLRDLRNAWSNILKRRTDSDGIVRSIDLDAPWRYEYEEGKINNINELIDEITDGEPLAANINYDRAARNILATGVFRNRRTGNDSFRSPGDNIIEFTSTDEDVRRRQIKEVYKDHYSKKETTINSAFSYFNDSTTRLSDMQKYQLDFALSGISKETHDLQQMNSVRGMYDVDANVLLATHKQTGTAQIIIIDNEHERKIKFERLNSNTIFGKYYKDGIIDKKHGADFNVLKATTGNYKMMSAAFAAMKLKSLQPDLKVEKIRYAPVLGVTSKDKTRPVKTVDMLALVPQASALFAQVKNKTEGGLSDSMLQTLDNPDVMNALSYNEDYLTVLYDLLNEGKGDLKTVDGYKKAIEDYRNDKLSRTELIRSLMQYQGSVEVETGKAISRADLARKEAYTLASKAILNLANIDFYLGRNPEKLIADKSWRAYSRIRNTMIQAGHSTRAKAESKAVDEFLIYRKKHSKLLDAFIKENDTTLLGTHFKRSYSEIFEVLLLNPEDNLTDFRDLMKLKSSESLRNEGKPAAAAYVDFYNSTLLEGFKKTMSAGRFAEFNWEEGNIPVMRQTFDSQISSTDSPKEYMKLLKDRFVNGGKTQTDSTEEIKYFLEEQYSSQNKEANRLQALGLNEEGEIVDAEVTIEKNLESVLDTFMIDAVRQKHMNEVLGYFRAMNNILAAAELTDRIDTEESRVFLDTMVQGTIHGEVDDEGSFGKWTDILNNVSTFTQLAFSPKQMVVELTTNLMSSLNTSLTQQLNGLFGGKKRFNIAQWSQAGGMLVGKVFTPKIVPILEQLGMIHADIENLYDDELKTTMGNQIFKSKYGFYINYKALMEFKNQVFVAESIKDGVLDAYDYDSDSDTAIYSERKDVRFFKADGTQTQDQKAFYEGVIRNAQEEGTLTEDGKLTRPYSHAEMQSKRDYYKDVFGSMSKEGKNNAQTGAFARLITKFKHWAQAKKDLYYSPKALSDVRVEWVKVQNPDNPDEYYYDLKNAYNEGIYQTIVAMRENVLSMMGKSGYEKQDLTDIQRENLSKVATDLIFSTIMFYVISGILDDEEFFNTELGQLVEAGMLMGLKDSQMWYITQDLSKTSMMASPAMLVQNSSRLIDGLMMASIGEVGPAADNILGITALTKAGLASYRYAADSE